MLGVRCRLLRFIVVIWLFEQAFVDGFFIFTYHPGSGVDPQSRKSLRQDEPRLQEFDIFEGIT